MTSSRPPAPGREPPDRVRPPYPAARAGAAVMEGLDEIPWRELEHSRGSASDVPALLRALTRAHEAADALVDLEDLLFQHGERVCTATAAATPFLVELAMNPDVTVRARIIVGLADNACEAEDVRGWRPVDPAWPPAWAAAALELVRLLDDDDAQVRRATACALAHAGPHADAVLDALLARFPAEPDPAVRRDLILAVGELTAHEPSAWLVPLRDDPDPLIRLAATIADRRTVPDVDTVVDAIAREDVSSWRCAPWTGEASLGAVVRWLDDRLADDLPARVRFAFTMLAHPDPACRREGVRAAAHVTSTRRSVQAEIGPLLAGYLDDPSETVRAVAVHLIVAGGSASAHRDRLAGLLDDRIPLSRGTALLISDLAVWGLAWAGDRRAQAGLLDRLTGRWSLRPPNARRYDVSSYTTDHPGLDELLARLDGWSDALLPAIRATLSHPWPREAQIPLMRALARWGPAAAPAVPELIHVLRTGAGRWAVIALGAIGPDAAPAVDHLRDLHRRYGPGSGERPLSIGEPVEIAWALWRITGDADPALDAFGRVPRGRLDHRMIRMIADLGPLAARHRDALHEASTADDDRKRVEALHALWRITGDEREAVRVLTRVVEPLAEGTALPVMRTATRYLAEIGPPAAAAISALRAALALDRRLAASGGWRAFDEDRRQRDLARDALRRISPQTRRSRD